jgi:2-methylcitrate dehydratase PrpD
MIEKVDFGVHPEAEAAGYEKMTTIIDIELTGGRRIGGRADFGKGSPANPMTDEELATKFRECAEWGRLPQANAEKVVDLVFNLEKVKSVAEIARLLAIGAKKPAARKPVAKKKPAPKKKAAKAKK